MPVDVTAQPCVEEFAGPRTERPQGKKPVEEQHKEKLEGPDDIGRRDGNALAMHLDGPLPLLQVKPGPEEEADDDRNGVSPVVPIVGRQLFHRDRGQGGRDMRWSAQEDADRAQNDEEDDTVAPLDAADIEFLAEQNACREDDQKDERKEKNLRFQPERHPPVADEREDGEGDGQYLIEEKNQAERARPAGEKFPQGFRAAILPPRQMMGDETEGDQPEAVRNGKTEEADQTELRSELYREKQPQTPHPGEADGVAPEEGVEPAVRFEFVGGGHG